MGLAVAGQSGRRRAMVLAAIDLVPYSIPPLPAKIRYTPDEELEALIRAGLGDVARQHITPEMHARAMRGEIVRPYEAAFERRRRKAYKRVFRPGRGTEGTSGAAGTMRKRAL